MYLRYTLSGHIFISPEDNCNKIVNAMLETGYNEDFCIADDFNIEFMARLMEAGFLVMSINLRNSEASRKPEGDNYILLPKLHLERSVLFFDRLHIKRSIRRIIGRYELKPDVEFDYIVDKCIEKHGTDWLTPPLMEGLKKIRQTPSLAKVSYPTSFALYRDGEIVAGEFGVICGKVYTGYSCYHDESDSGTARFIHTARYLQKNGFSFFDLGMPMDYKNDLGAVNISPEEFVKLFRNGRKSLKTRLSFKGYGNL